MSYQALYRKYRPQGFEDLIGQGHVKQTLMNTLQNNQFSHAYLFSGPRGTGKTSVAKLFAKAVNCLDRKSFEPCNECRNCQSITTNASTDVFEIDAASNNGIDEIRQIRENVNFAPSEGKYKVYIIDEVHMLSTGAFNALLKTLEEPPAHVIFILATTEPHKIPLTIISRCQRFDFRRISPEDIVERMKFILKEQGINVEEDALKLISQVAQGGMRDALSLLDQTISYANGEVTIGDVTAVVGKVSINLISAIVFAIHEGNTESVLNNIEKMIDRGKEPEFFLEDLIGYYRDILVYQLTNDPNQMTTAVSSNNFKKLSELLAQEDIQKIIQELMECKSLLKWSNSSKTSLEVAVLKLVALNSDIQKPSADKQELEKVQKEVIELKDEIKRLRNSEGQASDTNKNCVSGKIIEDIPDPSDFVLNKIIPVATKKHKEYLSIRYEMILQKVAERNKGCFRLFSEGVIELVSMTHAVISFPEPKHIGAAAIKENTLIVQESIQQLLGVDLELVYTTADQWESIKKIVTQSRVK